MLGSEEPTAEEKKQGIYQKLIKLDLYEVSLVPVPANQTAIVTEIKNDGEAQVKEEEPEVKEAEPEVKAGRRNSAKDEKLIREAISALQALLDIADDTDEGKDNPEVNEASEEQKESNPEKENLLTYIKSMSKENENDEV